MSSRTSPSGTSARRYSKSLSCPNISATLHGAGPIAKTRSLSDRSGDAAEMEQFEDVAAQFARAHGRRLRVATKYMSLTRRFFAMHGVTGYRIVESVGATEATPAAGTSELIVDITTTGTTLRANHLKVLEDGLILKSQAHLFASRRAKWSAASAKLRDAILAKLAS